VETGAVRSLRSVSEAAHSGAPRECRFEKSERFIGLRTIAVVKEL